MASSFSEFIVTSNVSLVLLIKLSFVCRSSINSRHQEVEFQCWLLCFSFGFLFCFSFHLLWLTAEKVTKICDPSGNWFKHPESNRTWTNYTQCNIYTREKVKVGKKWIHFTCVKKLIRKISQVSKLEWQSWCNIRIQKEESMLNKKDESCKRVSKNPNPSALSSTVDFKYFVFMGILNV